MTDNNQQTTPEKMAKPKELPKRIRIFNQNHKNIKGFTLVELMIAIAIIGIMAAVATPAWREMKRNINLKSDSRQLLADLQFAKTEAVRRNACVGIAFNTVAFPVTGGNYTIFLDDGGGGAGQCNRVQGAGENTLKTVAMNRADVSLVSAAFGAANSICFTPSGVTCGSQQGNIRLRNNTHWHQATVSASAGLRINLCRDSNNDGDVDDANECP